MTIIGKCRLDLQIFCPAVYAADAWKMDAQDVIDWNNWLNVQD